MMRLIKDQATCEQLDDGKCLHTIDPLDGIILTRGYPVHRRQSSGLGEVSCGMKEWTLGMELDCGGR